MDFSVDVSPNSDAQLGSRKKKQETKPPPVTVAKVAAIMYLREGEMSDPMQLAHSVGLNESQVKDILNNSTALANRVKCAKCGGLLESVPCVVCTRRKRYPRYRLAPQRPTCREGVYEYPVASGTD